MHSIQGRLLAGTVLGAGLVLLISGVVLYVLVRTTLLAEFDTALTAKARTLATLVEDEDGRIDLELDAQAMPEFSRASHPEYYEVWTAEGTAVARSPSLHDRNLERLHGTLETPTCRPCALPDGRPGRLVGITFTPRSSEEDESGRRPPPVPSSATLVVARDTADIDVTLAHLRILLFAVGASAIVAAGVILTFVVRRGLRPARQLAARIGQLGEADLSQPVVLPGAPSELVPIVQRLNDLLRRLDAALGREKSFSADVAHELRTPLAGLRTTLEVTLSRTRDPADYQAALTDALVITAQLDSMVSSLLSLARIEAGQVEIVRRRVDLADLLRECWKPLASRAAERRLHVTWRIESRCIVESDAEKVRQVLHNVLDNAITYTPLDGRVEIAAAPASDGLRVRVTNSGSQLTADQARHVFERFWRGDTSRHATGLHCGLGLSLSQKIMTLLGGSITAESEPGGDFRISIRFDSPPG